MLKFSVVCFVVVTVHFFNVECMTKDEENELIKLVTPLSEKCISYCNLNDDDMKKFEKGGDMHPCFKKCIMAEFGLLNADGKYDRDILHESISQFTEDEDKAQKIEDKIDSCFKANGDNNGDDEESQMKRIDVMIGCVKELKE